MKSTKTYSCIQETTIAKCLDWKRTSGSGARMDKGDLVSPMWLGECKTHVTPGHPIVFSPTVWNKLCREAMASMKMPVLFVDDGSQEIAHTWCLINPRISEPACGWHRVAAPDDILRGLITFNESDMHDRYFEQCMQFAKDNHQSRPLVYVVNSSAFGEIYSMVGMIPLQDFALYFRGK